jgi:hypothetical protein
MQHLFLYLISAILFEPIAENRPIPDTVTEAIRNQLDTKAIVIKNDDGELLTIWFRQAIPVKATADQIKNGLTYREISETALIGIVRFEKKFTDYRKQEIATGLYSLRIGFQPDTGDHKETAPHSEFVLLTPIANEINCDEFEMKQLVERSRKSTNGDHPGVILLVPVREAKETPAVEKGQENCQYVKISRAIEVNGKAADHCEQASILNFGIVISGHSVKR